jgi:hypothetical protein
MKYVWEPVDFTCQYSFHGVVVKKPGLKEKYILGYTGGSGKNVAMTSLNDGMVIPLGNPEEAAERLNAQGYIPDMKAVRLNGD